MPVAFIPVFFFITVQEKPLFKSDRWLNFSVWRGFDYGLFPFGQRQLRFFSAFRAILPSSLAERVGLPPARDRASPIGVPPFLGVLASLAAARTDLAIPFADQVWASDAFGLWL
jgi:hypothetical protein